MFRPTADRGWYSDTISQCREGVGNSMLILYDKLSSTWPGCHLCIEGLGCTVTCLVGKTNTYNTLSLRKDSLRDFLSYRFAAHFFSLSNNHCLQVWLSPIGRYVAIFSRLINIFQPSKLYYISITASGNIYDNINYNNYPLTSMGVLGGHVRFNGSSQNDR
jgi:hypothetical protein